MALSKTEAIVLRTRRQGETSKMLSLYTLHYGRISVMAKGARSLKSRYGGVLEPLTHIALVFYRYETRELHYLSQAEILSPFAQLHGELGRLALGAIPCEIIERNEAGGHANPALFHLLLGTITVIDQAEKGARNAVRAFMLRYLDHSGFKPDFRQCQTCRREQSGTRLFFDFSRGGFFCGDCPAALGEGQFLSAAALQRLHFFLHAPLEKSVQAAVDAEQGREMDRFLLAYLQYHIEPLHHLNAISYLENVQSSLRNSEPR